MVTMKGPEQLSLLCLNSIRIQSLDTSRGLLCLSVSLENPDELGESLLVLRSPYFWLMILSFIWQCLTSNLFCSWKILGSDPCNWKILGEPGWKTLGLSLDWLVYPWLKDWEGFVHLKDWVVLDWVIKKAGLPFFLELATLVILFWQTDLWMGNKSFQNKKDILPAPT